MDDWFQSLLVFLGVVICILVGAALLVKWTDVASDNGNRANIMKTEIIKSCEKSNDFDVCMTHRGY